MSPSAPPAAEPDVEFIDVHSHLYTPSYVQYLNRREQPPLLRRGSAAPRFVLFPGDEGVEFTDEFTSVEAKLAFMDANGIAHSVVSLGNPWLDLCPGPESVDLAASVNDDLAAAVRSGGGRLLGMAVLPNHGIDHVLDAIRQAHRNGLVAVIVGTSIAGEPLDSRRLDPVWERVASLAMPVLVHPQAGLAGDVVRGYGQAMTLGLSFPFETTAAIARMTLSGVFGRHRDLVVIAAHGGGTFPYLSGRLARAVAVDAAPEAAAAGSVLPSGLYVDSVLFSEDALDLCTRVLGPDRVLFGTDHPYPIADTAAGRSAVLRSKDAAALAGINARRLFLAARDAP